jgi:hypothetical protein
VNKYLIKLQRDCIKRIIKKSTTFIKNKCAIDYLGCSIEYFKNFILSKMTNDMSIENIHLDHIKPISYFNLDDETELQECCHYTNFQPLLISDNLKKSNKWSEIDDIFWKNNIIFKDYYKDIYIPKYN